jgi:stage II sporulation protein D
VAELELRFEHGAVVLHGDAIRWAIRRPDGGGLRSTLFERVDVRHSGGRPVEVKVVGRGYGHGVGLCQYGAMGMSQVGYDYTQILQFYYRGTELRKYY